MFNGMKMHLAQTRWDTSKQYDRIDNVIIQLTQLNTVYTYNNRCLVFSVRLHVWASFSISPFWCKIMWFVWPLQNKHTFQFPTVIHSPHCHKMLFTPFKRFYTRNIEANHERPTTAKWLWEMGNEKLIENCIICRCNFSITNFVFRFAFVVLLTHAVPRLRSFFVCIVLTLTLVKAQRLCWKGALQLDMRMNCEKRANHVRALIRPLNNNTIA